MWIDVNDCNERFHEIITEEGQVFCVHSDGSECREAEYSMTEHERETSHETQT
jgi:aminoglycoside N3'-acetyltransferase